MMSKEAYMKTQVAILTIGQRLTELPLAEFIEKAKKAESLGAVIDPALYRKSAENLRSIKIMAEKMLEAKYAFDECFKVILSSQVTAKASEMGEPTP